MKNQEEVYVSTDVETDGPIPGPNSMLSLGAAAYLADKTLLGTFSVNLALLSGSSGDPDTMRWWAGRPKEWEACRKDPVSPKEAMERFNKWVESFNRSPVFVGYPAGFDFTFYYYYAKLFTGYSPFSFSALDIKSFAMAVLGTRYRDTVKKNMPRRWFQGLPPHTHVAVDDAVEQGALFINILQESRRK
jgi:hypothetical protein